MKEHTKKTELLLLEPERDDVLAQKSLVAFVKGVDPTKLSSQIIQKQMRTSTLSYGLSSDLPISAELFKAPDALPLPPVDVVNKLIEWSLEQKNLTIQNIIFNFLEDPSSLEETLSQLEQMQVIRPEKVRNYYSKRNKKSSLTKLILRFIREYPGSDHQSILEYVRGLHYSKRPDAAARQALRQLIQEGRIKKTGEINDNTNYHIN